MTTTPAVISQGISNERLESPPSQSRLRVGFISACERHDRGFYSEIPYQMAGAFERLAHQGNIEFEYLGPIIPDARCRRQLWLRQRLEMRLTKRLTEADMYPPITESQVRHVEQLMQGRHFDLLIGNWTWHALLSRHAPVVLLRDATISSLEKQDGYEYFNNSSKLSRKWAHELERRAAKDCMMQFFTSEWAADSAIEDYGAPPDRIAILPFGANFEDLPSRFKVFRQVEQRGRNRLRLLFVGREWERKGGDFALEIVEQLNQVGQHAVLEVVGCDVSANVQNHPHVRTHGPLSKDNPAELDKLSRLFTESHYLLVPSRAECFGIVYAEASGFGLPSVARDVGGVSGAVNAQNGFLLPAHTSASSAARLIRENFVDSEKYTQLARSARHEYDRRLNWDSIARELVHISAARLEIPLYPMSANTSNL